MAKEKGLQDVSKDPKSRVVRDPKTGEIVKDG